MVYCMFSFLLKLRQMYVLSAVDSIDPSALNYQVCFFLLDKQISFFPASYTLSSVPQTDYSPLIFCMCFHIMLTPKETRMTKLLSIKEIENHAKSNEVNASLWIKTKHAEVN